MNFTEPMIKVRENTNNCHVETNMKAYNNRGGLHLLTKRQQQQYILFQVSKYVYFTLINKTHLLQAYFLND